MDDPHEQECNSTESVIVRLMTRFEMSRDDAMSLVEEITEAFHPDSAASSELVQRLQSKHRQAWHFLIAYHANQRTPKEMKMATRAMALELGYHTAAGADNVSDLARLTGFKKQTVQKCAENFQVRLGLPPRNGQRSDAARQNMTEARIGQLQKQ